MYGRVGEVGAHACVCRRVAGGVEAGAHEPQADSVGEQEVGGVYVYKG